MYVGPQVGSLVDLQREPRRCQEHRVAVRGFRSAVCHAAQGLLGVGGLPPRSGVGRRVRNL